MVTVNINTGGMTGGNDIAQGQMNVVIPATLGTRNKSDEGKPQPKDENGNVITLPQQPEVITILKIHRVTTASKVKSSGKKLTDVISLYLH